MAHSNLGFALPIELNNSVEDRALYGNVRLRLSPSPILEKDSQDSVRCAAKRQPSLLPAIVRASFQQAESASIDWHEL
jgi:hypothetical protein